MIKLRNNMIRARKSQMHVEMIMSFIIFVGFIFTILYFINPVKEEKISTLKINLVQERLLNNISLDYQTTSLILKKDLIIEKDCFLINNNLGTDKNLVVFDSNGNSRDAIANSDKIYISKIENERVYRLYFSDSFIEKSLIISGCSEVGDDDFSFGNLNNEKRIFYPFLESLNRSFTDNYFELQKNLGIAYNFDFIIRDLDKNIVFNDGTQLKTVTSNIIAREIPMSVLYSDATSKDFILNLRVW